MLLVFCKAVFSALLFATYQTSVIILFDLVIALLVVRL